MAAESQGLLRKKFEDHVLSMVHDIIEGVPRMVTDEVRKQTQPVVDRLAELERRDNIAAVPAVAQAEGDRNLATLAAPEACACADPALDKWQTEARRLDALTSKALQRLEGLRAKMEVNGDADFASALSTLDESVTAKQLLGIEAMDEQLDMLCTAVSESKAKLISTCDALSRDIDSLLADKKKLQAEMQSMQATLDMLVLRRDSPTSGSLIAPGALGSSPARSPSLWPRQLVRIASNQGTISSTMSSAPRNPSPPPHRRSLSQHRYGSAALSCPISGATAELPPVQKHAPSLETQPARSVSPCTSASGPLACACSVTQPEVQHFQQYAAPHDSPPAGVPQSKSALAALASPFPPPMRPFAHTPSMQLRAYTPDKQGPLHGPGYSATSTSRQRLRLVSSSTPQYSRASTPGKHPTGPLIPSVQQQQRVFSRGCSSNQLKTADRAA